MEKDIYTKKTKDIQLTIQSAKVTAIIPFGQQKVKCTGKLKNIKSKGAFRPFDPRYEKTLELTGQLKGKEAIKQWWKISSLAYSFDDLQQKISSQYKNVQVRPDQVVMGSYRYWDPTLIFRYHLTPCYINEENEYLKFQGILEIWFVEKTDNTYIGNEIRFDLKTDLGYYFLDKSLPTGYDKKLRLWLEKYQQRLRAYRKEHKDANVPWCTDDIKDLPLPPSPTLLGSYFTQVIWSRIE